MSIKKNVVIFFWEGYISVAPTIINLSLSLSAKGHRVTIMTREIPEIWSPENSVSESLTIIKLKPSRGFNLMIRAITKIPRFGYQILKKHYQRLLIEDLIRGSRKELKLIAKDYDSIGVDTKGLYWASRVLSTGGKLYYLSLELLCAVDSKKENFLKWLKRREISIHKKLVKKTFIQDKFRMRVLCEENGIENNEDFYILTNSPSQKHLQRDNAQNYFDELFSLKPNDTKVLMAGMIDDVTMSSKIAESFGSINRSDIKLIFHERQLRSPTDEYCQMLKRKGGDNFYLSLTPLPYNEIGRIYNSTDIGLVFYDPSYGDNIQYIIGASGKLTHYLMFGIPIIANNLPGFKELFDKYHIGVVINDMSELETAIFTIIQNYSFYSENAIKCFHEEYDFDAQFEKIYIENFA